MQIIPISEKSFFGDDKLKMISYAVVIAEMYSRAPTVDSSVRASYDASVKNIEHLYKMIHTKLGIKVVNSEHDPYGSDEEMIKDVHKNKRILVYTGHTDHPVYSPDINIKFRAVHDVFSHYGPHKLRVIDGKVNFKGFDFTFPGELDSYYVHSKYSPKACHAAYFSEIVGQVSYEVVTGNFGKQKAVSFGDDVDINRIGTLRGQALERQSVVYAALKGNQDIPNSPLRISTKKLLANPKFTSKTTMSEANTNIANKLNSDALVTWEDFKAHLKKYYRIKNIGNGSNASAYLVRNKNLVGLIAGYPKEFILRIDASGINTDNYDKFVALAKSNPTNKMYPDIIVHRNFNSSELGHKVTITVMERVSVEADLMKGYHLGNSLATLASYYKEFGDDGPPKDIGTKGSKYTIESWGRYSDYVSHVNFITRTGMKLSELYDLFKSLYYGPKAFKRFDLHQYNIGRRKNGSWVVFDP